MNRLALVSPVLAASAVCGVLHAHRKHAFTLSSPSASPRSVLPNFVVLAPAALPRQRAAVREADRAMKVCRHHSPFAARAQPPNGAALIGRSLVHSTLALPAASFPFPPLFLFP